MHMPAALVEVQIGDVVVGRHDVQINDPLRVGRGGPALRLQEEPDRALLEEKGRDSIGSDLVVVERLADAPGGPAQVASPRFDLIDQRRYAGNPLIANLLPVGNRVLWELYSRHHSFLLGALGPPHMVARTAPSGSPPPGPPGRIRPATLPRPARRSGPARPGTSATSLAGARPTPPLPCTGPAPSPSSRAATRPSRKRRPPGRGARRARSAACSWRYSRGPGTPARPAPRSRTRPSQLSRLSSRSAGPRSGP